MAARLTDFQNRSPLAVLCRQAAVFVIFSQNPIAEPELVWYTINIVLLKQEEGSTNEKRL